MSFWNHSQKNAENLRNALENSFFLLFFPAREREHGADTQEGGIGAAPGLPEDDESPSCAEKNGGERDGAPDVVEAPAVEPPGEQTPQDALPVQVVHGGEVAEPGQQTDIPERSERRCETARDAPEEERGKIGDGPRHGNEHFLPVRQRTRGGETHTARHGDEFRRRQSEEREGEQVPAFMEYGGQPHEEQGIEPLEPQHRPHPKQGGQNEKETSQSPSCHRSIPPRNTVCVARA